MSLDAARGDRVPFSTQVSQSLRDRARAAVRGAARASGRDLTLADLTEDALLHAVEQLEHLYNGGQPWDDDRPLRPGRRVR